MMSSTGTWRVGQRTLWSWTDSKASRRVSTCSRSSDEGRCSSASIRIQACAPMLRIRSRLRAPEEGSMAVLDGDPLEWRGPARGTLRAGL